MGFQLLCLTQCNERQAPVLCSTLTNCITDDTEGWIYVLRGVCLSSSVWCPFHQGDYSNIQMLAVPFHALLALSPPILFKISSAGSHSRESKVGRLDWLVQCSVWGGGYSAFDEAGLQWPHASGVLGSNIRAKNLFSRTFLHQENVSCL